MIYPTNRDRERGRGAETGQKERYNVVVTDHPSLKNVTSGPDSAAVSMQTKQSLKKIHRSGMSATFRDSKYILVWLCLAGYASTA
jgi:hypothetical protein